MLDSLFTRPQEDQISPLDELYLSKTLSKLDPLPSGFLKPGVFKENEACIDYRQFMET